MQSPSLPRALGALAPDGALDFSLSDMPLDELLFALHTGRFTGAVRVSLDETTDRIYFREGAAVGMVPAAAHDVQPYAHLLVQMKLLSEETLTAVWSDAEPEDGVALERALLDNELLDAETMRRAAEEHARRRLFALYDSPDAEVRVRAGLRSLAHFSPIYLDVRPAIAFGMVVRSSADRKATIADRVRGRFVRLLAPYDERRNSYGLPPPVLQALRDLGSGVNLQQEVQLQGISASDTAGLLLLFDCMSLLKIEEG